MKLLKVLLINTASTAFVIGFFYVPSFLSYLATPTLGGGNKGEDNRWKSIEKINSFHINSARVAYMSNLRNIIQYDDECFEEDSNLLYKPRSNSKCIQSNLEYKNTVTFGKVGQRTNKFELETHLNPLAIAVGDSHAMGWGVHDDQVFSSLLSKEGLKVLNLSVSSYGTARELHRLQDYAQKHPLAFKNTKYLIMFYCKNDFSENQAFIDKPGSVLNPKREIIESYRALLGSKNIHHIPFGQKEKIFQPVNALAIFKSYGRQVRAKVQKLKLFDNSSSNIEAKTKNEQGDYFWKVFNQYIHLMKGKTIIVAVSNGYGDGNEIVMNSIKESMPLLDLKIDQSEIFFVEIPYHISRKKMYYVLDDHLNEFGHKVFANQISKIIQLQDHERNHL